LNEEDSIESIIVRSLEARETIIARSPVTDVDVTVVSDGSTDRTVEIARQHAVPGGDRRFLWAGGLDDSKIFVFDVSADPAKPKREADHRSAGQDSVRGAAHVLRASRPDARQALSNTEGGGVTGMALYSNKGKLISKYAKPTTDGGDGYGYDLAINPRRTRCSPPALPAARTTRRSSAPWSRMPRP
jgi:hypothetical protein